MNNVSHGVAVLKDGKGNGGGGEGTKEEIRVGYAQDYEGGDIRPRERHGRRKSPPGEEAGGERTYATKNECFTEYRFCIHLENWHKYYNYIMMCITLRCLYILEIVFEKIGRRNYRGLDFRAN